MKKLLSITLAILLILTLSVPAFATTGTITDDSAPETVTVAGEEVKTVPIYGYIGPDTDVKDGTPIDYTDIVAVSVPVKLIWASFATTHVNEIHSPEYFIRNNSGKTDLNVELLDFTRGAGANEFDDSTLSLNLAPIGVSSIDRANVLVNRTEDFGTLAPGESWKFKITGTYNGSYNVIKTPVYNMTLKFEID